MRLAIISGGSKGLGLALCHQYKERGYHIVEFSRSAPAEFSVKTDFSQPEKIVDALDSKLSALQQEQWEEITVINNAAVIEPVGKIGQFESQQLIDNLNTNLTAGIVFVSEIAKRFQQHICKKNIINISSGAAKSSIYGWSLYCAAKAGLESFFAVLRHEQTNEPYPFAIFNINPGVIDTDMQAAIRRVSKIDFPDVASFIQLKDQGMLQSPSDVARQIIEQVGQKPSSISN